MAIDPFLYYAYKADNGQMFNIKLHESTGVILGISNVNINDNPPWPHHHKNLRHITGRDATGLIHRRLVVTDQTQNLYAVNGTQTWTDHLSNTIIREGRFGEKRPGTI